MPSVTRDSRFTQLLSPKDYSSDHFDIAISSPDMSNSRELPMPIVSRITSLIQAHATLQHCLTRLSKSWQGIPLEAGERYHFQQWLEQWEQAFTAFLSYTMPSMKTEDITRSRILKANHLACTILASDSGPDAFTAEFQAIAELATVILQSRQMGEAMPAEPGTLDVLDPLRVAAARCIHPVIQAQVLQLLSVLGIC